MTSPISISHNLEIYRDKKVNLSFIDSEAHYRDALLRTLKNRHILRDDDTTCFPRFSTLPERDKP